MRLGIDCRGGGAILVLEGYDYFELRRFTMETNTETGTEKTPSILKTIHEEWKSKGAALPNEREGKKLKSDYVAAVAEVERAKKALSDANEKVSAATLALAKAVGGQSVRINGQVHEFSANRGGLYIRRKSTEVVDL